MGIDPSSPHLELTGDPGAADYRLAVRVRPGADGGLVGAALRHLNGDNGLLFVLDSGSGDQRLVKRVKGKETVLWQATGAATAGREIGLTLEAMGERLAGWLDGIELFRLDDAGLPAGQAGIFTAGSPDVRFLEVRLTGPEWSTWYAFGGEDRLPAGTRVRISGGPEAGAVSARAAEARSSAASPPLLGRRGGCDSPEKARSCGWWRRRDRKHRRIFVPPAEFVALASPKGVRRADGTGLVLLPLGTPSPLIEGE